MITVIVLCVLAVVLLFVGIAWAMNWLNAPENRPAARPRGQQMERSLGTVDSSLTCMLTRLGLPVMAVVLVIAVLWAAGQ